MLNRSASWRVNRTQIETLGVLSPTVESEELTDGLRSQSERQLLNEGSVSDGGVTFRRVTRDLKRRHAHEMADALSRPFQHL